MRAQVSSSPKGHTHRVSSLPLEQHIHHAHNSTAAHTSTLPLMITLASSPHPPRGSLTPTLSPPCVTAHQIPSRPSLPKLPGRPQPSAPAPPSPHRRLWEHFSSPWLPPQTFLSLLLSLWREQHSLPARPARPAAWLSRGVSPHPHPPPTARRESLAPETGSLGQLGPPLCPGPGSWGEEAQGYLPEARGSGL